MILKGQNFRVFIKDGNVYKVVAKATTATITYTGNTEDKSTKDDVAAASKPVIMSKGWTVQAESLDVTNMAAILTAMKTATPFDLAWDEVSTADNQTPETEPFARMGRAFLNDATFTFNDRETASKNIQFTGSGAVSAADFTAAVITTDDNYTKGENVRLFLGSDNTTVPSAVIAYAKQLSVHVSVTLETATTKDTDGDWVIQEQTGITFDITSNAFIKSSEVITSSVPGKSAADIMSIFEGISPVKFQIANTSGDNHRTKGAVIMSGSVLITSITQNAANRANADYIATLSGYGIYNVSA